MKHSLLIDPQKLKSCFERQWLHHFRARQRIHSRPYILETFLRIDDQQLPDLYAQALELKSPPLNEEVFFICHLPCHSAYHHPTLIFYLNGRIICTSVTTNQLIKNFLHERGVSFNPLKYIAPTLGYHHKIPIAVGPYCFAPDRGTSKQNASWIALHHVYQYRSYAEKTLFNFRHYHELILNISKDSAKEMIQKGTDLIYAQQLIAQQWFNLFFGSASGEISVDVDNILTRTPLSRPLQCSVMDIFKESMLDFTHQVLKETLGEGNPYLDDLAQCLKDYGMGAHKLQ